MATSSKCQIITTGKPPIYKRERGDFQVLSPQTALTRYKIYLTNYEHKEILNYPNVYCVGSYAKKLVDYVDDQGNYNAVMRDHLAYRYEIIGHLGRGTFGQVVKCKDTKTGDIVAVKIIKKGDDVSTEIEVLERLMQENSRSRLCIIQELNYFTFRGHSCIVFECLGMNLFEALKNTHFEGFPLGVVKRFAYQLLKAVKLLSDHQIIHCDLKPENILLTHPDKSAIRLIDFGTSCFANRTVYSCIQTLFYRAPEVLLSAPYGLPIDMWSVGCVLAEFYTGHPLFPGKNQSDQLARIVQTLGKPDMKFLSQCKRSCDYFDLQDSPYMHMSVDKQRKNMSIILMKYKGDVLDKSFVDFIRRCVTWDPTKRMTPTEALEHPWIKPI
ncbi:hypothetical protein G6F56_009505 [Rhizopus delemar]|nr:hypothetical protein G6F56_009505 [Rhizopus delemar]